jgi:alkaline phosphatase D
MKINAPSVGPIVGYTTDRQTRLFLRGHAQKEGSNMRRCFGVVRWRVAGVKKWSAPQFNNLSHNFVMTGVLVIDALKADTEYEYQCGWFFADAELERIESLPEDQLEWQIPSSAFKTSVAVDSRPRSYAVGSCRYMLRLFGGTIFDDRGDKVFRSINQQIDAGRDVDALLMIGDQIYADDLNAVAPDTRVDQFLDRYRTVFSQEHVRRLMSRVPTYMILDDHEIEDNWPAKATEQDRVTLYPKAIHAYQIYQCSHSPLFTADDGRIDGTLTHFWYRFSDGCADWFVMDVRTERQLPQRRMINDSQMKALLDWLNDGSGRIKFVVTSVPFIPDTSNDSSDKWNAFPDQRAQILEHIRAHAIQKVIFVSGDVHCSFVSELKVGPGSNLKIHSIVSSSFFWPYPHSKQSDFLFDAVIQAGTGNYACKRISEVHSDDNFARIDATPKTVKVQFYERKGKALGKAVTLQL